MWEGPDNVGAGVMRELNNVQECREVEQEKGGCVVERGGSLETEKGEGAEGT